MKYLSGLLVVVILIVTSSAHALEVPNLQGRVNDYAGVISPDEKNQLEAKLDEFEKQTTNQVVVLTITSLDGDSIDRFGPAVFKSWKLGQKDKDNGILFTVVIKDHHRRIDVGYGLEGVMPDGVTGDILRNNRSAFDNHQYFEMINGVTQQIIQITTDPSKFDQHSSVTSTDAFILGIVVILAMTIVAAAFHALAGGIVGGFLSGLLTYMIFASLGLTLLAVVIGFIVGLILRPIMDSIGGVGGGGGWDSGDSWSSSDFFSGGGGDCGGGGASD